MKKRVICLLTVLSLLIVVFAPLERVDAGTAVRLRAGEKKKLTTTLKKPVWGSSDTDIATVTKKGVVKAKKKGRCYVSAVSGGKAEVFTVIVRKAKKTGTDGKEDKEIKVTIGGKTYTRVFLDDFDTFDSDNWAYCPEQERQDAGGVWRRSCCSVEDGNLVITCDVDDDGTPVSGGIRSTSAVEQTFGVYHFRFKMDKADGLWYAFWLLNDGMETNPPGNGAVDGAELDIIELVPHESEFCMSVHWDGYGKDLKSYCEVNRDFIDDSFYDSYHELWYVWDSEGYRFYMDGTGKKNLIFDVKGSAHGDGTCAVPSDMIISAEFGTWGGEIDKAQLPARFCVDYAEIYKEM